MRNATPLRRLTLTGFGLRASKKRSSTFSFDNLRVFNILCTGRPPARAVYQYPYSPTLKCCFSSCHLIYFITQSPVVWRVFFLLSTLAHSRRHVTFRRTLTVLRRVVVEGGMSEECSTERDRDEPACDMSSNPVSGILCHFETFRRASLQVSYFLHFFKVDIFSAVVCVS